MIKEIVTIEQQQLMVPVYLDTARTVLDPFGKKVNQLELEALVAREIRQMEWTQKCTYKILGMNTHEMTGAYSLDKLTTRRFVQVLCHVEKMVTERVVEI